MISAEDISRTPFVERELMLIKVVCPRHMRGELVDLCNIFRCKVADVSEDTVTIEVSGKVSKIGAIQSLLEPYGILEVARSGRVALPGTPAWTRSSSRRSRTRATWSLREARFHGGRDRDIEREERVPAGAHRGSLRFFLGTDDTRISWSLLGNPSRLSFTSPLHVRRRRHVARSRPERSRASPRAARAVPPRAARSYLARVSFLTRAATDGPSQDKPWPPDDAREYDAGAILNRTGTHARRPSFPAIFEDARPDARAPPTSLAGLSLVLDALHVSLLYLRIPARRLPRHRSVLPRAETRRPRRRGGQVHAHARR